MQSPSYLQRRCYTLNGKLGEHLLPESSAPIASIIPAHERNVISSLVLGVVVVVVVNDPVPRNSVCVLLNISRIGWRQLGNPSLTFFNRCPCIRIRTSVNKMNACSSFAHLAFAVAHPDNEQLFLLCLNTKLPTVQHGTVKISWSPFHVSLSSNRLCVYAEASTTLALNYKCALRALDDIINSGLNKKGNVSIT
jgi:hypothetical protein